MLKQTKKTPGRPYRSTNQLTVATVAIIALTGMGYVISHTDAGLAHTVTPSGVDHIAQDSAGSHANSQGGHTVTHLTTDNPQHIKKTDSGHLHVRDIADTNSSFWSTRGQSTSPLTTSAINNYPDLPATATSGDQINNHFDPNWIIEGIDTNNLWDGLLTAPRNTTVQKRGAGQTTTALSDIEHLQIQRQHPYFMVHYDGSNNGHSGDLILNLWVNKADFNAPHNKPIRLQLYDLCHSAWDNHVGSGNVRTDIHIRGGGNIFTGPEAAYPGTVHGNTKATTACVHPGSQLIELELKRSDFGAPLGTRTLRISSTDTSVYERHQVRFVGKYKSGNSWNPITTQATGWRYTNLFRVHTAGGTASIAKSLIMPVRPNLSQAVPGIYANGVNNAKTANANSNASKVMTRRWGIGFEVAPNRCDSNSSLIPSNTNNQLAIYDADYYGRTRTDLYNTGANNGLPKYDAGGNIQPAAQPHVHIFSTSIDNYRRTGFKWMANDNWLSNSDNKARGTAEASLNNPAGSRTNVSHFGYAIQQAAGRENEEWTNVGQQINYNFEKGKVYMIAFSNLDVSNDVAFRIPFGYAPVLMECDTEIKITPSCVVYFNRLKLGSGFRQPAKIKNAGTNADLISFSKTYINKTTDATLPPASNRQILDLRNNTAFWQAVDDNIIDSLSAHRWARDLGNKPLQAVRMSFTTASPPAVSSSSTRLPPPLAGTFALPVADTNGDPVNKAKCTDVNRRQTNVAEVSFVKNNSGCFVRLHKLRFQLHDGTRPAYLKLEVRRNGSPLTTVQGGGTPNTVFRQAIGNDDTVQSTNLIFSLIREASSTGIDFNKLKNNQLNYYLVAYGSTATPTTPINTVNGQSLAVEISRPASYVSGVGSLNDCKQQTTSSNCNPNNPPITVGINTPDSRQAQVKTTSYSLGNENLYSDSSSSQVYRYTRGQSGRWKRGNLDISRETRTPRVEDNVTEYQHRYVDLSYDPNDPDSTPNAQHGSLSGWRRTPMSNLRAWPIYRTRTVSVPRDLSPVYVGFYPRQAVTSTITVTPSFFTPTIAKIRSMLSISGTIDSAQTLANASQYPVKLSFTYNPQPDLLRTNNYRTSTTKESGGDGTEYKLDSISGSHLPKYYNLAARLVFTDIKINTISQGTPLNNVPAELRINNPRPGEQLTERFGTQNSKYGTGQEGNASKWTVSFNAPPNYQGDGIHVYNWEISWRLYLGERINFLYTPGYDGPPEILNYQLPSYYNPAPKTFNGSDSNNIITNGERRWTYFEGTYATCSRTLAVKTPTCSVANMPHAPDANKKFNPISENATTNRTRQEDTFPVSVAPNGYQHSRLRITNNGGIQLATDSTQHPTFQVTRSTTTTNPYVNTGYTNPTVFEPPDDDTQKIAINGGTTAYEESHNAVNKPGKFKSTWKVAWRSDTNTDASSQSYSGRTSASWSGKDLKSSACTGSANLSVDFFVYAEPPSCEVVRTAIEIGDPAPIIRVTIVNPNSAPMRVNEAKYTVSTTDHSQTPARNVDVQTGTITFNTENDRIVPASSSLTLTAPADTFQKNGQTNTGYGEFSAYKHDFIWALQTSMGIDSGTGVGTGGEIWTTQSLNGNTATSDYATAHKTWFEDLAAQPNQEFIRPTEASRVSDGIQCKQTLRVVYVSFFKVYGGDVAVGGHFGSGGRHDACEAGQNIVGTGLRDNEGAILAYSHNKAKWGASADQHLRGASTQHAVKAAKEVFGFLSAGPKYAGFLTRAGDPEPKKGLTFANDEATLAFGGNFGQPSCLPNYWSRKEQATPNTPPSGWSGKLDLGKSSVANNPDNDWRITTSGQQSLFHRGDLKIKNSASNQILNPATGTPLVHSTFKRTIYVEGNISIEDDIKLDNDHWKHPDESSYIFLIAKGGNIYIDPAVQRIDAVLVAYPDDLNNTQTATGGHIYTCQRSDSNRSIRANATQTSQNPYACRNQLRINGGVVAQKLHLGRLTHDTLIWSEPDNVPTAYDAFIRDENCNAPCDRTTVNLNKTHAPAEIFAFLPEFIMGTPADLPNAEDWIHAVDSTSIVPLNF